jgi:hypothetical protein
MRNKNQKSKAGLTSNHMKRIPVDWSGQTAIAANKVAIQIRSSGSLIDLILQNGFRNPHSLNRISDLNMKHLREWAKLPTRVLRNL